MRHTIPISVGLYSSYKTTSNVLLLFSHVSGISQRGKINMSCKDNTEDIGTILYFTTTIDVFTVRVPHCVCNKFLDHYRSATKSQELFHVVVVGFQTVD